MADVRRLNWGCGKRTLTGWINADSAEEPGVEISCDIILDGLPLESDSIDSIASQHSLQRLMVWDVSTALRELYRVLKPGGVLRLGLIDLDRAINAYQGGQRDYFWCWEWDTISGNFITQAVEYSYLRTPLTYEFVEELLRKTGFQAVCRVAYRQTTGPDLEIVALDCRPEESFYVEAYKRFASRREDVPEPRPANQIHLSWTQDPSTSLTVVWHTPSVNNRAQVEYRVLGSKIWNRVLGITRPSPGKGFLHRATITGLIPTTQYEYRVTNDEGTGSAMSETFRTRTAPAPGPADFCFAFICDTGLIGRPDGNATGTKQIIDQIVAANPLFVLGGGDYAYANRDGRYNEVGDAIDAWFVQMQPVFARFPFMAQYGNHEIFLQERFRDWAPRFAHPEGVEQEKSYSFEVGDVHFTSLFVPGHSLSIDQLVWLETDLANARKRGARWLIVYQHEPIYGHGHSHPASSAVRRILAPLFGRNRVDLHLSGHDQNYERTFPLIGNPDNPTPTSASLDHYEAGSGVIYAKISPAGKMSEIRNDFSRFTTGQQSFIAVRDDTAHHYALITVRATGELVVKVYSVMGSGTAKVLDSFCISAYSAELHGGVHRLM